MGPAVAKAQDVFTFDSIAPNPATPAFLTSGTTLTADNNPARTATFTVSSPGGNDIAFDFEDAANFGTNQSGTVLVDASNTPASDTLLLTFAQPITNFAVDYAISDFLTGPYTLTVAGTAYTGTLVGTSGDFEGTASTGVLAPFSSVLISFSGAPTTYALDNITVTPAATAAVPEPGAVAFALALGLPAAWQMRRKLARK